jgi:hypothetical protein
MTGIFTPAYSVSKRTGSDGFLSWRKIGIIDDDRDAKPVVLEMSVAVEGVGERICGEVLRVKR